MTDGKNRKISLRFTEEVFTALDDKRHRLRTSFQALGETLFQGWLAEEEGLTGKTIPLRAEGLPANDPANDKGKPYPQIDAMGYDGRHNNKLIEDLVSTARRVLESTHPIAGPALTTNIVAFDLLITPQESAVAHTEDALGYDAAQRIRQLAEDAVRVRRDIADYHAAHRKQSA